MRLLSRCQQRYDISSPTGSPAINTRPSPEPIVDQENDGLTAEELIPRRHICGMYGQSGHNRHSCKNV